MSHETDLRLAEALAESHPATAARVLERFPPAEVAALLAEWDAEHAAVVLSHLSSGAGAAALAALPTPDGAAALAALDLDAGAALLRLQTPERRRELLDVVERRHARGLQVLLEHPAGSAGSLADPLVLALPPDLTVEEATEQVGSDPTRAHDYLYVCERDGRLVGVTSARELPAAPREATLARVMHQPVMRLHAGDGRDAILAHPGWNEVHALPVVDAGGRFLGVVRHGTLRRLEREGVERSATAAASATLALGELYWMGLCGLLDGLGTVALGSSADGAKR